MTGKGTNSGRREGKQTGARQQGSEGEEGAAYTLSGQSCQGRRCLRSDYVPHLQTKQTQGIQSDCGTLW